MNLVVRAEPYGVCARACVLLVSRWIVAGTRPGSGSPRAGYDRDLDLDVGSSVRHGGRWEPRAKRALAGGADPGAGWGSDGEVRRP